MGLKNTLKATKRNIKRNGFLSVSTVFVIMIIFAISTLFVASAIIAKQGIQFYEKKAQVMVFFNRETSEEEIFNFRDKINNPQYVESIEYVSQEEAFELYKEDFKDDQDLIDTITADVLPPSLGIRANSIESLSTVIEQVNEEKEKNPYVDEVWYFEDVLDTMRAISTSVNYAVAVMVPVFAVIAFTLVIITVGFNVTLHKDEIEIMHLVGSDDSYIKWPFRLEGMFYGVLGGILSAALILVPWLIFLNYTQNSEMYIFVQQTLRDFGLEIISYPNIILIGGLLLANIFAGMFIGLIGSTIALRKHLNLKKG
jgi:cell division transport system permease protein